MSASLTKTALAALAAGLVTIGGAAAQSSVKIGLLLPMTGQQQSTGKQIAAAARLYMQQNGDTVAGKKIEIVLKDDAAVPDVSGAIAVDGHRELDDVRPMQGWSLPPHHVHRRT